METTKQLRIDNDHWASQRGAALIMTLMVTTLLLILGGALILTTGMATGLAVDSTPELQAYYAAEAGMNSALNVLRKNVQSSPAGTSATFRNALTNSNLNKWMTYGGTINGTSVVSLNTSPVTGYTVAISEPNNTVTPVGTEPGQLLIKVNGYGPGGSIKRLETLVDSRIFDYSAPATILMRGNDDGTSTIPTFAIGKSNAKTYSGYDQAHPVNSIPVFGVTHSNDYDAVSDNIASSKPNTVTGVEKVKSFSNSQLPSFLQKPDDARAFLDSMQATAIANGRYFTDQPSDMGTSSSPKFTFVDGDCSLSDGYGLLIVTGTLTGSGNEAFTGLIMVLGEGVFQRNGGGNGDSYGATVIAKFDRAYGNTAHPFGSPTYDMNGGGNSTTGYDSDKVNDALSALGIRTKAIREY